MPHPPQKRLDRSPCYQAVVVKTDGARLPPCGLSHALKVLERSPDYDHVERRRPGDRLWVEVTPDTAAAELLEERRCNRIQGAP